MKKRLAKDWSDLAEEAARQRCKTDEITWKMEAWTRAFREVKRRHLLKIMSEMNRISVHQYCWDHIGTVREAVVANEAEEFAEALHRQIWWVTGCTTKAHNKSAKEPLISSHGEESRSRVSATL